VVVEVLPVEEVPPEVEVVEGTVNVSDACEVDPLRVVATTFSVWVPAAADTVAASLVEEEDEATNTPSTYACICLVLLILEVASTRNGDATELPAAGALIVTAAWAAHKDRAMHVNVRLNKLENSRVFLYCASSGTRAQQKCGLLSWN
jgi:hypothetical protein